MNNLEEIGMKGKKAAQYLRNVSTLDKNKALIFCANKIIANSDFILEENKKDVQKAIADGIKGAFIDRLTLTEKRIESMAKGLLDIAGLDDPIGKTSDMKTMENGLQIGKKTVPLGCICIIYESRPNVTADAFGLCFKAGNSVILRGGKEALNSNTAISDIIRESLAKIGCVSDCIQLLTDTSRETAKELMRLNDYIDVIIPRGSASLINTVVQNSTIPIIETGTGNCHIFVDKSADLDMAINIIINAKVQRPGVCNACEKVLIHEDISDEFILDLTSRLMLEGVKIIGDEKVCGLVKNSQIATEEDWHMEYEDLIIAIGIVTGIEEAIEHIEIYSSHHSESIITDNYSNSQKFLNEVDSAAVYVNASTRFTDGGEFGFGAEIGISTQKLHARGPMGLSQLTTYKYIIYGNGQTRK